MDESAHELYVTDGYLNKRVIVFDSITLAFKRMWGAYGNVPNDNDPGPYKADAPHDQQFRSPVHCAHISNDGLVYVCDRANDRIQIFTKQGKFVKEFFVHPTTREPGTVCDIAFSHDPGQEYLLVADDTDNVIWTLRRFGWLALLAGFVANTILIAAPLNTGPGYMLLWLPLFFAIAAVAALAALAQTRSDSSLITHHSSLAAQTQDEAETKSTGCVECQARSEKLARVA